MNTRYHRYTTGIRATAGVAALASALSNMGCAGEKPFAKINGVTVTRDEYVRALERQTVALPNGQTINAERLVIDQLIGNRVILAEASKLNAVPTDAEVNSYYDLQKQLFENQYPGKGYEASMKEQGTAPEDIKVDMKYQLAETNLYARKLNVVDKDVRDAYDKAKGNVGLPARVQLRLVLVAPNSPDFQKAQQLFANKVAFDEIAKQVNPPQLRGTGGLFPQATPVASLGAQYQTKIQQSPDGAFFGPVDFSVAPNQPAAKAWVKIEKKLPAFNIPYDSAVPLIKKQLVAVKMNEPANQSLRNEIINAKLSSVFDPVDPAYKSVWEALKKGAEDSGLGRSTPAISGNPGGAITGATTGATAPKTP